MRFFETEGFGRWWERHRGKAVGAAIGFACGLLLWLVGVLWGLVIISLTVLGYALGQRYDEEGREGLEGFLDRIFGDRR